MFTSSCRGRTCAPPPPQALALGEGHARLWSHPFSLSPQIHNAPELALFCEGFFLKHMKALLEQDSFRQLIYGRSSKVQGLDPLQDLQSTLAERVHSVYITSRV